MTDVQLDMFGGATPVAPAQRNGDLFLVPSNARFARCRSCGAEIIWITTASGAQMPLSAMLMGEHDGLRYALPHWTDWTDCPHAAAHRKDTRIVTLASGDRVRIDAQGREVWLNEESA